MGIKIGLDVGGSTTKIVGMKEGKVLYKTVVKATDPVTSAFGAVGKLVNDNGLKLDEIDQINITGVGASFPAGAILGIKTVVIKEFDATGKGGLFLGRDSSCNGYGAHGAQGSETWRDRTVLRHFGHFRGLLHSSFGR